MKFRIINKWYKSKLGLAVFAVAELLIAYGLASLAIDRGNLWWYLLTFVFLFGTTQNIIRLIGMLIYHDKSRQA